jgi:hypothetical protein
MSAPYIPTDLEVQEALGAIIRGWLDGDMHMSANANAKIEAWFNKIRQHADAERKSQMHAHYRSNDPYNSY